MDDWVSNVFFEILELGISFGLYEVYMFFMCSGRVVIVVLISGVNVMGL